MKGGDGDEREGHGGGEKGRGMERELGEVRRKERGTEERVGGKGKRERRDDGRRRSLHTLNDFFSSYHLQPWEDTVLVIQVSTRQLYHLLSLSEVVFTY